MGNTFDAIGFEVADEEAYNRLAEYTHEMGDLNTIHRRGAQIHGSCWRLGAGLEVWTVLYESGGKVFYADCRPSFRSRHFVTLSPWELTEYDEDGEALVRGTVEGTRTEIVFELQNLTEIEEDLFRRPQLQVALAGLAYTSATHETPNHLPKHFTLSAAIGDIENPCENDYELAGTILSCKTLRNPVTHAEMWVAYLDTGGFNLDLLVNRLDVTGTPRTGGFLTASAWLQGHILDDSAIAARYEGVDRNLRPGDFWRALYRPN